MSSAANTKHAGCSVTMRRTGILGGTFDPIHNGHLDVAHAARTKLALDEVLLVPSALPPHRREPHASDYHRFAMTALAIVGQPGLRVSELEFRMPAPSYTSRTLHALASHGYGPGELFFITGADAFAEIETWKDFPQLFQRAHFVVVSRPGHPVDALRRRLPSLAPAMRNADADGIAAPLPSILLVAAPTADVSSSEVRRRLAAGESVDGLIPATVADHINRHLLYTGAASPAAATKYPGPA